jgi:hypothetical protein
MANRAIGGETGGGVAGVVGVLEICHVTGCARRTGEVVVAVGVALRALHGGVETGQCETGAGVIKGSASPIRRVVTLLASLGEIRLHVVGVSSGLVVLQVARHTRAVGAGQIVVAVDVALCARQSGVEAGQGEAGAGVVEGGAAPIRRVMALLASLGKVRLDVIGIGGGLVVLQVARDARRVGEVVVVVDVALRTLQGRVCARQWES